MAQETGNVDYESMVDKYMNEWEGCNLRGNCSVNPVIAV